MTKRDPNGRFVWYDLMTSDVPAAQNFYTAVIGWTVTSEETSRGPYAMWRADVPVGGMVEMPQEVVESGAPPHWLGYVGTPDLQGTVAQAEELGAEVLVRSQEIEDVGSFAVLRDPQGVVFCLWMDAPDAPPPPEERSRLGHVVWHDLATHDAEAAWAFYSELFGWIPGGEMESDGGAVYRMFAHSPGVPVGGILDKPPHIPAASWFFYIHVDDIHEAIERVKDSGGRVQSGPMQVPGGDLIAHCADPQGAAFALHAGSAA